MVCFCVLNVSLHLIFNELNFCMVLQLQKSCQQFCPISLEAADNNRVLTDLSLLIVIERFTGAIASVLNWCT